MKVIARTDGGVIIEATKEEVKAINDQATEHIEAIDSLEFEDE